MGLVTQNRRKGALLSATVKFSKKTRKIEKKKISPEAEVDKSWKVCELQTIRETNKKIHRYFPFTSEFSRINHPR